MTDHYELLGVGSDATKDEIKAAYRSEVEGADSSRRAQLNRAWNVLSDPVQRQRYDEQVGAGSEGGSGEGAVVLPASRATGARARPGEQGAGCERRVEQRIRKERIRGWRRTWRWRSRRWRGRRVG